MPNILLASGGYDNSIKLWDITQKFAYRTLKFTESVKIILNKSK